MLETSRSRTRVAFPRGQIAHDQDDASHLAAVADTNAGMEGRGPQAIDDLLHRAEKALVVGQAHRGPGRLHQHHERVAAFSGEIAVDVMVDLAEGGSQTGERGIERRLIGARRFRRGLGLVVEIDYQRIGLPRGFGLALGEGVVHLHEVLLLGVESAVLLEEVALLVDPVEDARHHRGRQRAQLLRERVDEPLSPLQIVGADDDGERRQPPDSLFQLLQTHRGRCALREQLAQIGSQVAVQAHREGHGRDEERGADGDEGPGPLDRGGRELVPEAVALAGTAVPPRRHPAPWRRATAAIDSRSKASPCKARSSSMVRAGCSRMAWV